MTTGHVPTSTSAANSDVPVFVDTNVLVYAFDNRDPVKQSRAIGILEGDEHLVLSAQVLGEFYLTVTRKLSIPLTPDVASRVVEQFALLPVVPTDARLVTAAVATSRMHGISYCDALIVEAAVTAGCDRLLSEDLSSGSILRGVRIENPFA